MKHYLAITHKQLEATRLVLWDLALEAEGDDRIKDRDKLLDAMDLVVEELVKIELSPEWEEYIKEGK